MHPAPDASPIPPGLLEPRHVLFDMVYRPRRTRLLQHAEKRGCVIIEGIEMLLNQAALQFERWTGESAPMDAMRQAALAAL
jgi:shikimate dehydrogenase